jgi:hypothetical protein
MAKKRANKIKKRRMNDPVKRINQELREFKNVLRRLVDKTRIIWEGEPYQEESVYKFTLSPRLVQFILAAATDPETVERVRAAQATTAMASRVREALEKEKISESAECGIVDTEGAQDSPVSDPDIGLEREEMNEAISGTGPVENGS